MRFGKGNGGNRLAIWFLTIFMLFSGTNLMAQIVVKKRPKRPQIKVVKPKRPGKNHIWVDGHWVWNPRSKNYVWKRGHWVPKRKKHRYVAGHWEKVPGGWKWLPGTWVTQKTVKVGKKTIVKTKPVVGRKVPGAEIKTGVVKKRPKKPNIKVKRPKKPGPQYVWIRGHWRWNPRSGNYVWKRGHWAAKRPGFRYVPGKWKKVPGGFYWVPGAWVKK